jgi:uncharacterized protein YjiS (DUF1127 family)
MANFETARPAPFGAITTYQIIRFFSDALERAVIWNDARVTRNALAKLSDRELDDIGLTRADVYEIGSSNKI